MEKTVEKRPTPPEAPREAPRPGSDAPQDALREALRAEGLRMTRQRAAIVEVLDTAEDHPDASDIHERAKAIEPTTSLATVYRTLSVLSDKGVINRLSFQGAPSRFETTDAPHHDHIVDLETGAVIEFVSPEIERLQREVARANGYEVVWHRLELYCRKMGAEAAAPDKTDTEDAAGEEPGD